MNQVRRRNFAALAAVIVPGAEAVDVAGRLLDEALAAAPALAEPLAALLDGLAAEPPELAVARLEHERRQDFQLLLLAATGSYLLNPNVRRRIGYPGQEALVLPTGGEVAGESLLEPVLARGPRWRGHAEAAP